MIEFQHILCIAITSRMYSVNCSLFTKLFKHLLNLVNMQTDNRNLNFKCMNNYKILSKIKEHESHPNGYVFGIICSYSVMSYIFISIKKEYDSISHQSTVHTTDIRSNRRYCIFLRSLMHLYVSGYDTHKL